VQGEYALDPYAVGHFTHGKRASSTSATEGNNNPFKSLYTLTIPLNEPDLHTYRIASAKIGEILFHLRLLKIN
jgi:hypothetical protein